MNKVRGLAPLSRGWMDETLAPVPLLRLPTCSVHGQGAQLRLLSLSTNKACKCTSERCSGVTVTESQICFDSPRCHLLVVCDRFQGFFPRELAVWEQGKDEAR